LFVCMAFAKIETSNCYVFDTRKYLKAVCKNDFFPRFL